MSNSNNEKIHLYWGKLGEFVHYFALTEGLIILLMRKASDVDEGVAKAVFSGVKSDTARSFIKRIYEAKNLEIGENLGRCLDQFGQISSVRNDILHYGPLPTEDFDDWTVSNHHVQLESKSRSRQVGIEVLDNMISDLDTIRQGVLVEIFNHSIGAEQIEALGFNPVELVQLGAQPWLYKPQQQAAPRQKRPNPRQRLSPPPKPSQA